MNLLYIVTMMVNAFFLLLILVLILRVRLAKMERKLEYSYQKLRDVANIVTLILSHAKEHNNHPVKFIERLSKLLIKY